jgi:hypothetical protein
MSKDQPETTHEYGRSSIWLLRVFMLITASAGVYSGFEMYQSYESIDWPSVSGRVDRSWRTDSPTVPHVRYSYKVGKKGYQGNRVAFGDVVGVAEVKRVMRRFPAGKEVPVYYEPDNPANSVLEPGYGKGSWVWILAPWGMFLVAVLVHRNVSAEMKKRRRRYLILDREINHEK